MDYTFYRAVFGILILIGFVLVYIGILFIIFRFVEWVLNIKQVKKWRSTVFKRVQVIWKHRRLQIESLWEFASKLIVEPLFFAYAVFALFNRLASFTEHIVTDPFDSDKIGDNSELIERWHGTLKSRTKTLRGLKSIETANNFLDGYLVFYNYLRPHESLDGKTPAEKAKVEYPLKTWVDITRTAKPQVRILVTPAQITDIKVISPFVRPIAHRNYNIERKNKLRTIHNLNRKPNPTSGIYRDNAGTLSRHRFKGSRRVINLGSGVIRHGRRQHLRLD